jgi:hypothetical protein
MTTEIIADVDFTDPTNLIPYLEKDEAIIRGVTKALVDLSNPDSYAGGAPAFGSVVKSLTADAATGSFLTAYAAPVGGMLDQAGSTALKALQLPATFKLANTVKRFLALGWVKLPGSGWQTASGNVFQSLFGYMDSTSTLVQWGFYLVTVQATGVPSTLNCCHPVTGGVGGHTDLSNADTLALCDGNLHQIALHFDGESSPGNRITTIYVDKVAKFTATTAWDGSFNTPAANPKVGHSAAAFQANYPAGTKLGGRPSIWDLTGTAWTPAQILQRDWDAAQGYLA